MLHDELVFNFAKNLFLRQAMKYFRESNVWLSLCLPRSVTLIGETEIAKSVYTFPYVFFPCYSECSSHRAS